MLTLANIEACIDDLEIRIAEMDALLRYLQKRKYELVEASPPEKKRRRRRTRKPKPEDASKDPNAVALGKLGGAKGGAARAASLSPEERSEIASQAAKARWKNDDAKPASE